MRELWTGRAVTPILPGMKIVALVGAVVVLLAGCSSSGPSGNLPGNEASTTPGKPTTHAPQMDAVRGTFSLTDPSGYTTHHYQTGVPCHGISGYGDIRNGAEVIVTADTGRTLAIVALRNGTIDGRGNCTFTFAASVPAGLRFYGVTVTNRGTVKEPESALGSVSLKLG